MLKPSGKSRAGYFFLAFVGALYLATYFLKPQLLPKAVDFSLKIFQRILPVFVLIFILLALTNYFVKPKTLVKYLGKGSGWKGWLLAIGTGILSTGPIYMWYPLLAELKEHGMRPALIATFLYNRAIKPALIPLMIIYFGWKFVAALTIMMVGASVLDGWLVEKAMCWK